MKPVEAWRAPCRGMPAACVAAPVQRSKRGAQGIDRSSPSASAPLARSLEGAGGPGGTMMDFTADRRKLGRGPGPWGGLWEGLHPPDPLCPAAEALEDFLLNFLVVAQDESGKAVTSAKYMAMLVGPAAPRGRRPIGCRPLPPPAARLFKLRRAPPPAPCPCGVPTRACPALAASCCAATHRQPSAQHAGGGPGRPGGVQQGPCAGGARGAQHAAVPHAAGRGCGQHHAPTHRRQPA